MAITALGYMGARSPKLDEWSYFAGKFLGMQQVDSGAGTLSFRMDDWRQRFVVTDEVGNSLGFMGWQVEHPDDLEHFAAVLDKAGTKVTIGDKGLCDQRFVDKMIYFHDPDGNRVELFYGAETATDPFISGRPIEGFVTGPYGMGHAVMHVEDANRLLPFYRDLLGFSVSDYGLKPYPMYFFHVNGRHHSFAIIGSGRSGLHHFMVEFANLDDVGQAYDLASMEDDRIAYTLGRHTNDWMTSFYSHTPCDFFIESGWGGRIIDMNEWVPHETNVGPSFWGHERIHLKDHENRTHLREMRLQAAKDGLRVPNVVDCPWLYDQLVK
ncbi:VOC family protein [Alphaproteobacteria bacterium]|nr:VOC family protein [Alphaproteobacteria bacterium]